MYICMYMHVCLQVCLHEHIVTHSSLQSCMHYSLRVYRSSYNVLTSETHPSLPSDCRYQEAIRLHPGCPAEVRLGLAACYFRLGQLERARKAYERVVQLSPTCAEALYGLAVLRFSSSQGESAKAVSARANDPRSACSTLQHIQHVVSFGVKRMRRLAMAAACT